MKLYTVCDSMLEALHVAGERVPAGRYVELTTGRTVALEFEDLLPASLDGKVAVYRRQTNRWGDIARDWPPSPSNAQ